VLLSSDANQGLGSQVTSADRGVTRPPILLHG